MPVKRSAHLSIRDFPLGIGGAVTIWGTDTKGNTVCRLHISNAGMDVYVGKKKIYNVNWERLVQDLTALKKRKRG
jgi:hypothetical protein